MCHSLAHIESYSNCSDVPCCRNFTTANSAANIAGAVAGILEGCAKYTEAGGAHDMAVAASLEGLDVGTILVLCGEKASSTTEAEADMMLSRTRTV